MDVCCLPQFFQDGVLLLSSCQLEEDQLLFRDQLRFQDMLPEEFLNSTGSNKNGRAANGKAINSSHLECHQTPAMNGAI